MDGKEKEREKKEQSSLQDYCNQELCNEKTRREDGVRKKRRGETNTFIRRDI